jgi:hypothetical protein
VLDLVAYDGLGTRYMGPTVSQLQNTKLISSGVTAGGPNDVFNVFDALTVGSNGLGGIRSTAGGADTDTAVATTHAPREPNASAATQDRAFGAHSVRAGTRTEVRPSLLLQRVSPSAEPLQSNGNVRALDAAIRGWIRKGPVASTVAAPGLSAGARIVVASRSGSVAVLDGPRNSALQSKLVDAALANLERGRLLERSHDG